MNMNIFSYYVIFISLIYEGNCARILAYFAIPSISHQAVFRPIIQELLRRGHELVVITTEPVFPEGQTSSNLTEINTGEFSYKLMRDAVTSQVTGDTDMVEIIRECYNAYLRIFVKQMQYDKVKAILNKDNTFDLLLVESCARLSLALSYIFKIPTIQISTMATAHGQFKVVGAPRNLLLYPDSLRTRLQNLTFSEMVSEGYLQFAIDNIFYDIEEEENDILREMFGEDAPTMNDLMENVTMVFSNMSPLWEGIRPTPLSLLYLGGLHLLPSKDLPQDLKSHLDLSPHGVIYFSLGTNANVNGISKKTIQIFVNVFSHLSYDIIWKWDSDELPSDAKNIKFVKWIPQSDVLKHPNVKLLITQGGLQSTDEAIEAGVPLIGIPLIYDQWYNVEKYLEFGIGVRLDMSSISEEKLRNAIATVLEDDSYRRNVLKLRSQMRDRPHTSLSRTIWWIEYVLRHGGTQHLQAPEANMSWSDSLELNLFLSLFIELLIYIILMMLTLYYIFKYLNACVRSNFV